MCPELGSPERGEGGQQDNRGKDISRRMVTWRTEVGHMAGQLGLVGMLEMTQ